MHIIVGVLVDIISMPDCCFPNNFIILRSSQLAGVIQLSENRSCQHDDSSAKVLLGGNCSRMRLERRKSQKGSKQNEGNVLDDMANSGETLCVYIMKTVGGILFHLVSEVFVVAQRCSFFSSLQTFLHACATSVFTISQHL